ncbi:hypothetical protein H1C71_040853 [Ictidomys tridecemlineatus]|nr:hypothetical protein H1C71_040853 [Ictidomys tridecemlineatus]
MCCYLDSPNRWRGRYRCSPGLTSLFATRRSSPTAMGASRPGVSLLRLFLSPAHLFWRIHTIHARCPKAARNRGSVRIARLQPSWMMAKGQQDAGLRCRWGKSGGEGRGQSLRPGFRLLLPSHYWAAPSI